MAILAAKHTVHNTFKPMNIFTNAMYISDCFALGCQTRKWRVSKIIG